MKYVIQSASLCSTTSALQQSSLHPQMTMHGRPCLWLHVKVALHEHLTMSKTLRWLIGLGHLWDIIIISIHNPPIGMCGWSIHLPLQCPLPHNSLIICSFDMKNHTIMAWWWLCYICSLAVPFCTAYLIGVGKLSKIVKLANRSFCFFQCLIIWLKSISQPLHCWFLILHHSIC